jgi:Na+/melibiose symporter-like transporter/quercetin dioxygenase-like cupin family protein
MVMAAGLFTGVVLPAAGEEGGSQVKPVIAEKLPNAAGKSLTAVVVSYAPGGKSAKHHHAGSVFVYVLSGSIRSEVSGAGPAKVYKAGESFFEPPGSEHLVSENASDTEPASLLAVFVADDGARLTTFDNDPRMLRDAAASLLTRLRSQARSGPKVSMTSDRLRWRELFGYALPAIPSAAISLPLSVYVAPFYALQVGLGTGLVGVLFFAVRAVDIAFDPLIGVAGDRIATPWGRRRPWLVAMVAPMMVAVFALFNPPAQAGGLYLTASLIAVYFGYSVLTINHTAWGAELSGAYHERSRIAGARQIAFIGGMLLVLILPALLELRFGAGAREKVAAMGWFVIIGLPLAVGPAVVLTGEPRNPPPGGAGLRASWRWLLRSRTLQTVLGADLAIGLATSITAALYLFVVEKTFGLKNSSTLLLCYFIAALAGAPVWTWLSYRFGKHRTLAAGALSGAAVLTLFVLVPRDGTGTALAFLLTVGFGISYGAGPVLLQAIMADVIDQEAAETGDRRAGAAFALLILTNKIGYALSVGITYPLLELIGFSGKDATAGSATTLNGILAIFVVIPVVLLVAAAALVWRFPLGEHEQLRLRTQIAGSA